MVSTYHVEYKCVYMRTAYATALRTLVDTPTDKTLSSIPINIMVWNFFSKAVHENIFKIGSQAIVYARARSCFTENGSISKLHIFQYLLTTTVYYSY